MEFQLIIALVKSEITEKVTKAGKKAGAPGSTVLPARGTGIRDAKTFFGLELNIATDVILFLLEEHLVEEVMDAISAAGSFDLPGTGVAFVLPVLETRGLRSQLPHFERLLKRHPLQQKNSKPRLKSGKK